MIDEEKDVHGGQFLMDNNGWAPGESEGQTHRKMEGEVSPEAGMEDGVVVVLGLVGGIDGFHAQVEAQDEVV